MTKIVEKSVSANVLIKGTVHEVSAPVDKSVVRSRGPKSRGQAKQQAAFQVNCTLKEWNERWAKALKVLKGEVTKPTAKADPKPPEEKPPPKAAPKKPAAKKPAAKPASKK
jgi:hypothetical protein